MTPRQRTPRCCWSNSTGLANCSSMRSNGQPRQIDVVGALFDHGLQREMLVACAGRSRTSPNQAGLQMRHVPLDVAADHEERGGHADFAMDPHDGSRKTSVASSASAWPTHFSPGTRPGIRSTSYPISRVPVHRQPFSSRRIGRPCR